MTSISSIETVTATKQPPVEQDLTPVKNGHPLTADYDDPPPPSQWKGKERQHSYDVSDESDEQNSSEVVDASAYPPTTEDAAESRRIEEVCWVLMLEHDIATERSTWKKIRT